MMKFFCMQSYLIIVRKFFWLSVRFWTKILAETERLNDTKTEISTETNTETESFRLLIVSHVFACLNFFGPLIHGLIIKFNSKLKVNYNKKFNDYSVHSFGGDYLIDSTLISLRKMYNRNPSPKRWTNCQNSLLDKMPKTVLGHNWKKYSKFAI
jgi:hypothetical protein